MRAGWVAIVAVGVALGSGDAIAGPPAPRVDADTLRAREKPRSDRVKLRRHTDGSYTYRDGTAGFVATIQADGRVKFRDVAPFSAHIDVGQGWFAGFLDAISRPPGQRDRPDLEAQTKIHDSSALAMEPIPWGPYGPPPIMVKAGGRFGAPGERSRSKRSNAKLDFLKQTESMRKQMAEEFAKGLRHRALFYIGRRLTEIWRDDQRPLFVRKKMVFDLWDDTQDGEVGDPARARIIRFVRSVAPLGSPNAFTPDDLRRLNTKRTSRARFEPYSVPDLDRHHRQNPRLVGPEPQRLDVLRDRPPLLD